MRQCFRADLQEGAEYIQFTLALQWGISHESHHSCRKDPFCSGPPCPSCPSQGPSKVYSFSGNLPLRQLKASILFKGPRVWEKDKSENQRKEVTNTGYTVFASHTPTNMSTAILLRLPSLSSMRDSWIGTCEEAKGLYHTGVGTKQKRVCTMLSD